MGGAWVHRFGFPQPFSKPSPPNPLSTVPKAELNQSVAAFLLTPYDDRIPDPTKPENSARIAESFKQNLRPQGSPGTEVTAYLTHPWHLDPLAKEVWSCWGPQAMSKFLAGLQLPHGRVVFASADWADGWRGFIDGAIGRGYRAVREVLEMRQAEHEGAKTYARL